MLCTCTQGASAIQSSRLVSEGATWIILCYFLGVAFGICMILHETCLRKSNLRHRWRLVKNSRGHDWDWKGRNTNTNLKSQLKTSVWWQKTAGRTSDEDFWRMPEDCWRREDGSDDFNGASDVAGGLVVEGEQFFKILGRGTVATSSHTSLGISIYRRKLHL